MPYISKTQDPDAMWKTVEEQIDISRFRPSFLSDEHFLITI